MLRRLSLLLALALGLSACAGARQAAAPAVHPCGDAPCAPAPAAAPVPPPAGAAQHAFEDERVEVSRLDLELSGKNDEELFAIGQAAFAAGEHERAATAFARLADLFPRSGHHATALFDAGLSYQRLERWRPALERFTALARGYEGPDAVEALFKAAECRWHLGELPEAWALLDGLSRRDGQPPAERIRALAQRGVVELEQGRSGEAEATLRLAVSAWKQGSEAERLDDYYPAQAQFYLGEVYRAHFLAVRLDPAADGEGKLAKDLEDKAELLLSAQGHYLRTIRMNDVDWAVAAGFRIGELYDALHAALTEAPLPPGLTEEEAEAYRGELKKKVRVLVTKAISVYEQTLAVAGRARREQNRFVAETQASLERMKRALADLPAEAAPPPPRPAAAPRGKG